MAFSDQHRLIRSYVRREGRITPGQKLALKALWPKYGIEYSATPVDFSAHFQNSAERVLEIGFGNGESLLEMARQQPNLNFIGIEVHAPGVGALLAGIERFELSNLRLFQHDAVEVLAHSIEDESLSKVQIFFPDPWPKKKHHKRRLVQPPFIALVHQKLKRGGLFHLATDWGNYSEQMMSLLSSAEGFTNVVAPGKFFTDVSSLRMRTKFERRGLSLGHSIWDLVFRKE